MPVSSALASIKGGEEPLASKDSVQLRRVFSPDRNTSRRTTSKPNSRGLPRQKVSHRNRDDYERYVTLSMPVESAPIVSSTQVSLRATASNVDDVLQLLGFESLSEFLSV
jgi:hypothetical protein